MGCSLLSYLVVCLAMPWMGSALYLGLGGVVGQRTTLTGSTWPPYPGAGQGYWARKAGFYSNRSSQVRVPRSADPLYLGFGGVVGQLTPRTGPSEGSSIVSDRRSSSSSSSSSFFDDRHTSSVSNIPSNRRTSTDDVVYIPRFFTQGNRFFNNRYYRKWRVAK